MSKKKPTKAELLDRLNGTEDPEPAPPLRVLTVHTPHRRERKRSTYCCPASDLEVLVLSEHAQGAKPFDQGKCFIRNAGVAAGIEGLTIRPYIDEAFQPYVEALWKTTALDGTVVDHKAYAVDARDLTEQLPLTLTTANDAGQADAIAAKIGSDGLRLRFIGHTERRKPPGKQSKKQPYAGSTLTPDAVHGRAQRIARQQSTEVAEGKRKTVDAAVPDDISAAGEKAAQDYAKSFRAKVQAITRAASGLPVTRVPNRRPKNTPLRP
jgi:hypothetical protein